MLGVGFLLLLSHKIAYWSFSALVISDLVVHMLANVGLFSSACLSVISPRRRKPAHDTMKAVLTL